MENCFVNPFTNYTAPVSDARLVGRQKMVQHIQETLQVGASCCLSGLRRIGKTSVAKQVLKNISAYNNCRCCYIPLYTIKSEQDFYKLLSLKLFPKVKLFDNEDNPFDMYLKLCDYLSNKVYEDNFSGIVVLDEFDSISKDQIPQANMLINRIRELINCNTEYHLSFLFVSAKSLKWLQDNTANASTLAGICTPCDLKPFTKQEGLVELLKYAHIDPSSDIVDAIFEITGGHPYLASALLHFLFKKNENNIQNITPEILHSIRNENDCASAFIDYYSTLKDFFATWKDISIWNTICNITIGPYCEKPTMSVMNLIKRYGIISDENYCFSEDFHDFLELDCRQTPIWHQFSDIEKTLRNLVKSVFIKNLGNNWITELRKKDVFFEDMFSEFEKIMYKEQKKFQLGDTTDILEYSYLGNLKDIILKKWSWFQTFVGNSKPNFIDIMDRICILRNPLAHNRKPELIPEEVQASARSACTKLEELINAATEQNVSEDII